jgi:tungstate transport system ATP-binding protein
MSTLGESFALALQLVLRADPEVMAIAGLSLRVSLTATVIGGGIGLLAGTALAVARFPGRFLVVGLLNTLLAIPPVVVGLTVYLMLSRAGPLGTLGILFTPAAMVVAQSLLVIPLVAALTRRLVSDAMQLGGEQLRSLGATPLQAALLLLAHERMAVLTLGLTAFGRAISEVGAVMIVGGNIDGVTRVMTTAIALETSKGDLPLALALGVVLLALVGVLNGLIALLQWQGARAARAAAARPVAAAVTPPPVPVAACTLPQGAAGVSLLQLQGSSVRLEGHPALQEVSLALHAGERVMLVGPNGAGKTTLLRLLHGLVAGTPPVQEPAAAQARPGLRGAMLFQRPFLLRVSVQRNVALGLWLQGVPAAERAARSAQALARVGLAAHARRPALALSGGQQQRLALARAWALQPALLLLDEPTASLDPGAKREIESLIEQVAAAGVTLVMSTHNLGQAKRLGSRVVCLEGGRVVADLPVERFFGGELPPEAAAFVRGELPWR